MLYLLTYGDIRAVDPELWTGWSAALLHKLYAQTERRLRGEALVSPGQLNALVKASVERLGKEWEERAHEHFRLMGGGRMPFYSIQEIAEQIQAVDAFTGDVPCVFRVFSESEDYSTAVFAAKDRLGMFADLAGALAVTGLEPVLADLNARADGIAVDTLQFAGGEAAEAERADRGSVRSGAAGQAGHQRRSRGTASKRPSNPPHSPHTPRGELQQRRLRRLHDHRCPRGRARRPSLHHCQDPVGRQSEHFPGEGLD